MQSEYSTRRDEPQYNVLNETSRRRRHDQERVAKWSSEISSNMGMNQEGLVLLRGYRRHRIVRTQEEDEESSKFLK